MNSAGPPGAGNPHARWDEGASVGLSHAEILRHCHTERGSNCYGFATALLDRALLYTPVLGVCCAANATTNERQ